MQKLQNPKQLLWDRLQRIATPHSTVTLFARFALVHIGPARASRVIRKQLQRHHMQQRRQRAVVFRHAGSHGCPPRSRSVNRHRPARTARRRVRALLQVAFELFEQRVVRRDRDDRIALVTSASGPCLSSPARVRLGMDVADLLELQRTFKRDRVVQPTAQEQRVLLLGESSAQLMICGSRASTDCSATGRCRIAFKCRSSCSAPNGRALWRASA